MVVIRERKYFTHDNCSHDSRTMAYPTVLCSFAFPVDGGICCVVLKSSRGCHLEIVPGVSSVYQRSFGSVYFERSL